MTKPKTPAPAPPVEAEDLALVGADLAPADEPDASALAPATDPATDAPAPGPGRWAVYDTLLERFVTGALTAEALDAVDFTDLPEDRYRVDQVAGRGGGLSGVVDRR